MTGLELLVACAPMIAPATTQQIIQVESNGNPLAIGVNGGRLERQPRDAVDAAALARKYIAAGYSVDLGLMQVNSRNLRRLGYRVEEMFEPCKNIAAGARVLAEFYASAKPRFGDEQTALRAALSAYNTGNFNNGFTNGYLARYGVGSQPVVLQRVPALNPYTSTTAVFIRQLKEDKAAMNAAAAQHEQVSAVVSRSPNDADVPGVQIEYTAEEAERNGAFDETALTEQEAWESNAMLDPNATGIVVGGRAVGGRTGTGVPVQTIPQAVPADLPPEAGRAVIDNSTGRVKLNGEGQ